VSQKIGTFTASQNLLIFFGTERPNSILKWYHNKFSNWLRTNCVVSITTVATWHTRTANFWAAFKQRIIDRAITSSKAIVGLCLGW